MNNASESASQDGDESMLFDDGFAIVDDINTPSGSMEVEQQSTVDNQKTATSNGKDDQDLVSDAAESNSEGIVSDGKKEESSNDKTNVETPKNTSKISTTGNVEKEADPDPKNIPAKTPSNSSLAISSDVDLGSDESTAKTDKSAGHKQIDKVPESEDEKIVKKAPFRKKPEANFVWVSNISKLIKASTLKKHFSECGKVNTAKVVTNGKVFFGYVEFEAAEHAAACVKSMNNSVLGGRKVLVSRNRPDITKKSVSAKKTEDQPKTNVETPKKSNAENVAARTEKETKKKEIQVNKESGESGKDEKSKEKKDDEKRKTVDKKEQPGDKTEKTPKSTKTEDDLKRKLNDSLKNINRLKKDLDRSHVEASNLRRRLASEQKRTKAEEMRSEKYRSDVRNLSEQLKQARNEFERDIQRLIKKHKLELDKFGYQRDSQLRKEEELKRRHEEVEREFRKLEEAKKSLERMKRSRKSRSLSPPVKRYRGGYTERKITPPPPPKLTSDVRSKVPSTFYDEKKTKGIYNRLGDYGDKGYAKETNGRHRSGYADDGSKSSWPSGVGLEDWKKSKVSTITPKNYADRFGSSQVGYQMPSSSLYQLGSDYFKHGHFESSRKY